MLQVEVPAWLVRADRDCSDVDGTKYPSDGGEERWRVPSRISLYHTLRNGAHPVSPRWRNERAGRLSEACERTWKPDQRVALVSNGERADQCYDLAQLRHFTGGVTLTHH